MNKTLVYIKKELSPVYPPEEVNAMVAMIFENVCHLQPHQYLFSDTISLTPQEESRIYNIVERLKTHEPIQYVLGEVNYMGMTLEVNPNVLIPRPETSELIELICKDYRNICKTRILELGTGSGCIAIALALKLHDAHVVTVDISQKALNIARRNAERNGVRIDMVCEDMRDMENLIDAVGHDYDIVVSNPPYITEKEKADMEKNVLDYEPGVALFVPDDAPMLFYKSIAELSSNVLCDGGRVYVEINRQYGELTAQTMRDYHLSDVKIIKDIYNNDRIVTAKYEDSKRT